MWAIIPLKDPENAKSRLSNSLDPEIRQKLYFSLAGHVIETLRHCLGVTKIAAVTASTAVAEFAAERGATVIWQDADEGTSAAFACGVEFLRSLDLQNALFISSDLPLLSVSAVESFVAASSTAPSIVIAPDRHSTGTNALLCSPPDVIKFCFGRGSFQRHCREARASGASIRIMRSLEFGLDIDVLQDIEYLKCLVGYNTMASGVMIDTPLACSVLISGVSANE